MAMDPKRVEGVRLNNRIVLEICFSKQPERTQRAIDLVFVVLFKSKELSSDSTLQQTLRKAERQSPEQ